MAQASSIEHCKDILRVLKKAKPALRKSILERADKGIIYSICELCDNTLAGNVPLTEKHKRKIKKYKNILRELVKRGDNWKQKKQTLVQHGGAFLPILISLLSSVLGTTFLG